MKIVAISDTHGFIPELPEGDILVHAGDLTLEGSISELELYTKWLASLPYDEVICTEFLDEIPVTSVMCVIHVDDNLAPFKEPVVIEL